VALIAVDAAGANQISVAPGANALLRARHAEPGLVAAAGLLLAQLECDRELFDDLADAVHARGGRAILNPAPAEDLPPGTLNRCDFLIPNETELASLTGMPTGDDAEVLRAALRLTGLGVGAVVATLGERGALWTDGHAARRYPAPRVRAVDTTGAGDAFCAGFAAALCAGRSVDAAIAAGSASGAFCVTRTGVLDGLARPAELAPQPAAAPSWPVELPVSLR
jgi:ribokinase